MVPCLRLGYSAWVGAPGIETFEDWQLVLQTPWGTPALVVAGLLALAVVGLAIHAQRRERWLLRLGLVGLRALVVSAVLVMVLQPAVQLRNVTRIPNHVAVLVDTSRSMGLLAKRSAGGKTVGGLSRLEQSRALLAASSGRLQQWAKTRHVDFYGFDDALAPWGATLPSKVQAKGEGTRIRRALEQLRQRYRGDDLAGVVLLSDGADNGRFAATPTMARSFAASYGAPLHTVLVGQARLRDVAIVAVLSDDFAFVRNALKVEADVLVSGVAVGESLTVTLASEGREIARQTVQVRKGEERYRVVFDFVPPNVGTAVYEVATPVLAGEALTDNNRRTFLLRVIRDRIRVLQVCGRPSWDQRFLRRLLKRDPNVDLISFFILRTPSSQALVPPSELSLIPFPTEELFERELGSFDLVILQNFNYGPYGIGIYLPHLRRYVLAGGGLAMLGGDLSFASGGYSGTPVAEVLPLWLPESSLPPERLIDTADFRPRPTKRGWDHPILQLGRTREATAKLLAALPALSGVNRVRGARPGATVLAEHPTLKDDRGAPMPVLATREVGKGRTLALTTDTSWHWAFAGLDGAGDGAGDRVAYDRFWRNAIRWLIRDPELKYLRVILQGEKLRVGRPLRIVLRAYNPDYSPAQKLPIEWELTPLTGGKTLARRGLSDEQGELRIDYLPVKAGAYRVRARAKPGGRETEEQELFLVQAAGVELRDPRPQPLVLRELSAGSGGRYLGVTEALPELSFRSPRVLRVNSQRDVALWSSWWALLLVISLLALEWGLRRLRGQL